MARKPTARGFTRSELRSLRFESFVLAVVVGVALVAAAVSFSALYWLGSRMNLAAWAAPLIPLAIDGFAVACSVGIVRSQSAHEKFRERASEWVGLSFALALSVVGNVAHGLNIPTIPTWIVVAYAGSIPVIVAYLIHVYGRAMVNGISSRVLVDDPGKVQLGLGAPTAAAPAKTQARRPAPTTRATPAPVPAGAEASRPLAAVPATAGERDRARALFDQAVTDAPHTKPDAARIHTDAGVTKNPATTRRWVAEWWEAHQSSLGGVDRDADQLAAEAV